MLNILQIIVSIVLIILILIQEKSSGLSGVLGGSGGTAHHTKRGLENLIHWATIVTSIVFVLLVIAGFIF
ncbi:MAG: preprotein translocase subunit SecG [Candidatus Paceibacterota bacterium]